MRREPTRGFTMVELVVAISIVAILGALAYDTMRRARPRATFSGVAVELQAVVHGARLQALADGMPVAVLVFPDYVTPGGGQGRIIVYEDGAQPDGTFPFFKATVPAGVLNFDGYDPAALAATPPGRVVTTLDLPPGVKIGPPIGLGVAALPFPYGGVTTNVACSFCTGTNRRGAIAFDQRGRVSFYSASGTPIAGVSGGSVSIYGTDLTLGSTGFSTSTLVVTSPFGAMRTFHNG